MTGARRSAEEGGTRTAILDATETIMREEGYAAVSSRRVAERAGLKSQLVHYHFGTMDDLFAALYARTDEAWQARHREALAQENPFRALWEMGLEPQGTELIIEFIALANHRKDIKARLKASGDQVRARELEVLGPLLRGTDAEWPIELVSVVLAGVSRAIVTERMLGIDIGHDESLAHIASWFDRVGGTVAEEAKPPPPPARRRASRARSRQPAAARS